MTYIQPEKKGFPLYKIQKILKNKVKGLKMKMKIIWMILGQNIHTKMLIKMLRLDSRLKDEDPLSKQKN
jgi:hypothetical protein